ncbi:hypothetical protein TrLO_g14786 [Triparma laevis f. longispina]|uniref:Uncharacterized protein n=1 Tax=Triparma laevis f. longispina TaxID=1714387 RepID=A0A9W7DTS1_9STRA|nr:hypothetical protein TrLO_g14786 [Triparma laevis f. longispina]
MPGIFFNEENFKLALPLITLCTVYAFFKLIPIFIALPLVFVSGIAYKLHVRSTEAQRTEVISSLENESSKNEKAFKALMEEEEKAAKSKQQKKQKKETAKKSKKNETEAPKMTNTVEEEEEDSDGEYDYAQIAKKKN